MKRVHSLRERPSFPYDRSLLLLVMSWSLLCCFSVTTFAATTHEPSPPIITLAFSSESMAPYYTVPPDTPELGGAWRQKLDKLFIEQLGWNVRYIFRPWQRAQNDVKSGNADGFITIITEERLQYAIPVPATFSCFPMHLFTWKNHPQLEQMKQIATVADLVRMDLELVSNIGNGWYKNHIERQGVQTIWLPTDEQMIKFVARQRGDGLIDLPASIAHLVDKFDVEQQIVDTGVSFGTVDVHLMISKSSPLAARIHEIHGAMAALINDGTFAAISAAAGGDRETPSPDNPCKGRSPGN